MHIANVVVDCRDVTALAGFWSRVLDAPIVADYGEYAVVGDAPAMTFQQVDEPTPGKNRWHVDLETDDLESETQRLLSLGARLVESLEMHGGRWNVLADPEGNVFCVATPFDIEDP